MTLVCYTDASYCNRLDVAACGFTVYKSWQLIKHQVLLVGGIGSTKMSESFAICRALEYCFLQDGIESIVIHTDQINAQYEEKRCTLHQFKDIHEAIVEIQKQGVTVEMKWVKAHSGNLLHNKVDRSCNRELKKYKKKNEHEKKGIKTPVWSSMYPEGRRSA